MRQYWINFKGNQEGPMSLEQLAQKGLDETAYVWHSGLADWVKITTVPELNDMLNNSAKAAQESPAELPEQEPEAVTEEVPELETEEVPELPQEEAIADEVPSLDNVIESPAPNYGGQQQYAMPVAPQQGPAPEEAPKCPPTNLVWSIIATVLCCSIPGILGIVFAFLTKKYYREGNLEKAQRMSDYGAWSVIISIMLGIISMPLSCAMNIFKVAM